MNAYSFREMEIKGVFEITPFSAEDERGGACKEFSREEFFQNGIDFWPHESMTIASRKNVLRGLHFQRTKPQDKLVRCMDGHVWAVVVDLRMGSKTFGKWLNVNINEGTEAYIPKGCGFGTLALCDSTMLCLFGERYYHEYDSGIAWDDKELGIQWPIEHVDGELILSKKDCSLGSFSEYRKIMMGETL